jgi:DNA-binding FrmR family transcriptional regulator
MPADKLEILRRLHSIEGHVGGIRKMIEEDNSYTDVLHQTYAVRKAIQKLEVLLVEQHLACCVHQGIESGDEIACLATLIQLYQLVGNQ